MTHGEGDSRENRGRGARQPAAAPDDGPGVHTRRREILRKLYPTALIALWLGTVAAATGPLWRYELKPGATAAAAPPAWPESSRIPRGGGPARHTLVAFLHPHCPCSRATLRELERIVARCGSRLDTHVLFVRPPGAAEGWERSGLWQSASAVPGVSVACDEGGSEAARFGARTSGQVFLFDPSGRLAFRGGITASRGHEGDNAGADAVGACVLHPESVAPAPAVAAPVFGCALLAPGGQPDLPQQPAAGRFDR